MNYFIIAGISQGFILSLLLFHKSISRNNNAWLIGMFVLAVSLIISGSFIYELFGEPLGSFLVDPLLLLLGPTLYLYIRSFLKRLTFTDLLKHYSAFILYIPIFTAFYFYSFNGTSENINLQEIYGSLFAILLGVLKFCHLGFYVVISFKALQTHRQKIKNIFSNLRGKDLMWLDYLLYAFIFLVATSLVLYMIALNYPLLQNQLTLVNLFLLSIFILVMAFYAFNQNNLLEFSGSDISSATLKIVQETKGVEEPSKPKYEKSGLRESEVSDIKNQIGEFLKKKEYLDPELTLTTMAKSLNIAPNKLSEVLSKYLDTSFYDLINSHRIEEIKHAIFKIEFSNWTILAIAFEHGYNSKSTFNSAFKKYTGMTPTQFKQANAGKSRA